MKAFAIFLVILCLLAIGGSLYLLATSTLNAYPVDFKELELTQENQVIFEALKVRLEEGTFTGTRFSGEALSDPDQYRLFRWTVRIENNTFLPARVAEIQVIPNKAYDILQFDLNAIYSDSVQEYTVKARSSREIEVYVLSSAAIDLGTSGREKNMRDANITWYLGGFPFPETNGKGGKLILKPAT